MAEESEHDDFPDPCPLRRLWVVVAVDLMFALGLGVIAVAATGDLKLWAFYVSVVAIGAKVLALAVQYVVFRILVINRIRSAGA
jgi:hypothetical protein